MYRSSMIADLRNKWSTAKTIELLADSDFCDTLSLYDSIFANVDSKLRYEKEQYDEQYQKDIVSMYKNVDVITTADSGSNWPLYLALAGVGFIGLKIAMKFIPGAQAVTAAKKIQQQKKKKKEE